MKAKNETTLANPIKAKVNRGCKSESGKINLCPQAEIIKVPIPNQNIDFCILFLRIFICCLVILNVSKTSAIPEIIPMTAPNRKLLVCEAF